MSDVVGEVWVAVRPETAGFAPALSSDVSRAATQAGARAGREAGQSFSQSFRNTLKTGAAVIGVLGAIQEIRKSIDEAASHAGEISLLNQAITNAGASETILGKSAEDAIRAQALQRGFIDEELYPAFTRLLRATDSSAKSYRLLGDAEDIARQRHVQVGIAALALAKFEQGSATALQRLGVILPQHIRDLKGAAKETEGLAYVEQQFAGSAQRFADSGAGAFQRFAEARHVIEESAGAALAPEFERIANATADWASKSENLARVEHDVADVTHVVAGAVKAGAGAFELADRAVSPLVSHLGGLDKATELVVGAVILRKIQLLALAWTGLGAKTVAAETGAAAATTTYTEALALNTLALERNFAASRLNLAGVNTLAVGTGAAAAETEVASVAAGAGASKFLALGVSAGGLGSVLKSGVAPAAILAGYELSKLIRKFPGWDAAFEHLGAKAEGLAEKLNLVKGGGISGASAAAAGTFSNQDVQARLIAAYKTAVADTRSVNDEGFRRELEDKIVAKLVGPGYTFSDARVFATNAQQQHAAFAAGTRGAGARRNYDPLDAAAARAAGRPTDVDYQIQLQNALATKATADEEALYRSRLAYISKRIAALSKDTNLTADEKKNLLRLETERNSLEQSIVGIQDQAAKDAQAAADKAKQAREKAQQAYTNLVSVSAQGLALDTQRAQLTQSTFADDLKAVAAQLAFDRREAADKRLTAADRRQYLADSVSAEATIQSINQQIHAKELQSYHDSLSLEEQRLQLAAQRAQLTANSVADDKAAARKLFAFYRRESHDAKLTEQERLQYASQAINETLALRGLTKQAQGATAGQIFGEAAAEFRNFGSNIAGRNGVLSGQDERANFARLLLDGHTIGRAADDARHTAQITELQRQTSVLTEIRNELRGGRSGTGTARRPPELASENARQFSGISGM